MCLFFLDLSWTSFSSKNRSTDTGLKGCYGFLVLQVDPPKQEYSIGLLRRQESKAYAIISLMIGHFKNIDSSLTQISFTILL